MSARAIPALLLLVAGAALFTYALLALGRRDDLFALLAIVCGALALWALRRSVELLEGS